MQKIILFLILMIVLMLFTVWIKGQDKKPIQIEPITIETLQITQKVSPPKVVKEKPIDILSKLKVATNVATEGITPSKEEVSNKLLKSLKKTIAKQEIKKPVVAKLIVKKVVTQKVVKKKIIAKKVKVTQKRKIIKSAKVITKKKIIKKKPIINNVKIVNSPKSTQKLDSMLSREEEVALYHKKYASGLEVVNVSQPFEIKEEKSIPDSRYFKPQKPIETITNTTPTKFVKTLGVVSVSNAYETSLVVPKKVEVAKEGIVNLPNTNIETEEMKKLKFVDTLGVVEVSKDFETIEANKYLK